MLNTPMDVLTQYPVRKTKTQKEEFQAAVFAWAKEQGYSAALEKGRFGSRNIVMGDPEKAAYLVTAHYDTPARMILPNLLTPCSLPAYLGWQLLLIVLIGIAAALLSLAESMLLAGIASLFGTNLGDAWILFAGLTAPSLVWINVLALFLLMILGPANRNNANDNTSGVVTVLEIMRTLPENQRSKVCFVLFDLEEAGLIGSGSYRKAHKDATKRQIVLNLDCVGDGDFIRMFPTKKLKKDRKKLTSLYKACGYFGKKSILVHEKGFSVYPSDQKKFPLGVGICALRKHKKTLYLSRIHTAKDTVLEITNVNLLRAAITTYISGDAAQ